jgi:hypothetical protein
VTHTRRNPSCVGPGRAPILAAVTLIATFGSPKADVTPVPETRVVFKRGAVQAEAYGTLTTISQELRFVVRARAKQHMRLTVDAPGPTRGFVKFPSGEEVGSPGSDFFDDTLPADGDYRIRINESPMAEEWQGSVTLHVHIE